MNKKLRAIASAVLCLAVVAPFAPACGEDEPKPSSQEPSQEQSLQPSQEPSAEGSVIIGSTTQLSGSFGSTTWGNNAADNDIRTLTNGYETVQLTRAGEYVWDTRVTVKNHWENENPDGSKEFKIEINHDLKFSDGSDITAKDYVGYALAMASPVCKDAGVKSPGGSSYIGGTAFNKYNGTNDGQDGASKVFSGIRLYDDYTFSYTMGAEWFPYYYENTYAAFAPYAYKLWIGNDVEIKDDGQGCYFSDNWYAKDSSGKYVKAANIENGRYATTERPCAGPYKYVEYNKSTNTCKLTINEYYKGNWEGQKPSLKNIAYIKLEQETQFDLFKTGGVDIISGLADGEEIQAGRDLVEQNPGKYAYTSYPRSGYGKLVVVGDTGPTQFVKTRQALSRLLDKNKFAQTFTGGYGEIVYGPYGLASRVYLEAKKDTEWLNGLEKYEYDVEEAKDLLIEDGWVYNADGTAYSGSGVRYKKLTAAEAELNNNKTYASGNLATVQVGDDYYMPLSLNWCSSEGNSVSDLLNTMLVQGKGTSDAGMKIVQEVVDFDTLLDNLYREDLQKPYCLFNLATGFTPIYDYAGYWMTPYSKSNIALSVGKACEDPTYTIADKDKYSAEDQKLIEACYDEYMAYGNNIFYGDEELDQLSWDMVYTATTFEQFVGYFKQYITRWNQLVPEIPLYSNLYHDVYNAKKIANYEVNPDWETAAAILYCTNPTK